MSGAEQSDLLGALEESAHYLAALVRRSGGVVWLTPDELAAAEGLTVYVAAPVVGAVLSVVERRE